MKMLIYGAGVIGTLYAAKLQLSGHCVTVLARGQRLSDIRQYGLVLEDMNGDRSTTQVDTIEHVEAGDHYDIALVTVRRDQIASVMPRLIANRHIPTLLFMLNNPNGSAALVKSLGQHRLLLGFPGAGGMRLGHVVQYSMIAQQPTTLGELDGQKTARLHNISEALRRSGFRTAISRDMDTWLKVHAFFVTAVSGAIYLSGGDCLRLSKDNGALALMTQGVREGFTAVRALGLTVRPFPLGVLFTWLPQTFAIRYWRRFLGSKTGDYVFGRHARVAFQEMREIANDCRELLEKSGVEAPALLQLYHMIDVFGA